MGIKGLCGRPIVAYFAYFVLFVLLQFPWFEGWSSYSFHLLVSLHVRMCAHLYVTTHRMGETFYITKVRCLWGFKGTFRLGKCTRILWVGVFSQYLFFCVFVSYCNFRFRKQLTQQVLKLSHKSNKNLNFSDACRIGQT